MIAEYALTTSERQTVDALATEITGTVTSLDDLLRDLPIYSSELPRSIRRAIYRFSADELHHALVLRQTGFDPDAIPPTPAQMPTFPEHDLHPYDIPHLLFAGSLGEVFTFDSIQSGTLISDVFPVRANADLAISSGYSTAFSFHTDDAFTDYAGAFLGLRCLRNPTAVATAISHIRAGDLTSDEAALLRLPAYDIRPNLAHAVNAAVPKRAVLFGAADAPYVRINLNLSAVDGSSTEQRRAYERLVLALKRNQQNVVLSAGDCLYIDNYRAVHGRDPYEPRLDGTDRWYRRVYISKDLRASRAARATATSRVIKMETA